MTLTPEADGFSTPAGVLRRILAGVAARVVPSRAAQRAPARVRPATALRRQDLAVPMLDRAPELQEWAAITSRHAGDWQAGKGAVLIAALREADQGRITVAGGKRLAELISHGARAALSVALSRRETERAMAELARFADLSAAHPDDYAAAHLLARAHLDIGWSIRGEGPAVAVSEADWSAYCGHVAAAEAAIDRFDPVEAFSPLLAGTRYLLVRGIDEGAALFRDWYEDWCDLDPTNWPTHALHATHLLPQWFGQAETFDAEARAAAGRTADVMGDAAYAMMWMATQEAFGAAPKLMQLDRFLKGLADMQRLTGCQYRANIAAARMADLAFDLRAEGREAEAQRAILALGAMVRGDLREVHLATWATEARLLWALGECFAADLGPGQRIVAGEKGLCVGTGRG